MNSQKEHIAYLNKQGKFIIDCNTDAFNMDEIEILQKYGHWFQALCSGKLEPFTMMQEQFISVYKGEYDPVSFCEVAWNKYLGTKNMESKPGDAQDRQYLPYEDTFYNRDMRKQNRNIIYGIMMDNHWK